MKKAKISLFLVLSISVAGALYAYKTQRFILPGGYITYTYTTFNGLTVTGCSTNLEYWPTPNVSAPIKTLYRSKSINAACLTPYSTHVISALE